MMARDKLSAGFIMLFGDVIFDKKLLINHLVNIDSDIVLLVDNSFNLKTRQSIKSTTDLVLLQDNDRLRKPNVVTERIGDIGNNLAATQATHEFIGIAKFSKHGASLLMKAYDDLMGTSKDQMIDFNTLIKHMINEGVAVDALEVNKGWSEVHSLNDIAVIEKDINRLYLNKREKNVA